MELAELEQIIYAIHYDKDVQLGNPRTAWVKVGLVLDLSHITDQQLGTQAEQLKNTWQQHWQMITTERSSVDLMVKQIDMMRDEIKRLIRGLE